MTRRAHNPAQPELALGDGSAGDPLLDAYNRTRLGEFGISFERARRIPHLKLPLTRVAQQLAAARIERSPACTPG